MASRPRNLLALLLLVPLALGTLLTMRDAAASREPRDRDTAPSMQVHRHTPQRTARLQQTRSCSLVSSRWRVLLRAAASTTKLTAVSAMALLVLPTPTAGGPIDVILLQRPPPPGGQPSRVYVSAPDHCHRQQQRRALLVAAGCGSSFGTSTKWASHSIPFSAESRALTRCSRSLTTNSHRCAPLTHQVALSQSPPSSRAACSIQRTALCTPKTSLQGKAYQLHVLHMQASLSSSGQVQLSPSTAAADASAVALQLAYQDIQVPATPPNGAAAAAQWMLTVQNEAPVLQTLRYLLR